MLCRLSRHRLFHHRLQLIATPFERCRLELNKLLWVVRKIEPLLVGHEADAPLLHSQGAEQDFDGLAVFVLADLIDDHRVGEQLVPLHLGDQKGPLWWLS